MTSLKRKVEDFRAGQKLFKDWQFIDRSIANKKKMNKVSVLSYQHVYCYNSDNHYSLLDSITFIHVFHDKDLFIKFKRVTRVKKLLCDIMIIVIKSWGEILLSLRLKNKKSILILNEIVYIPNFLLNLILLSCFEDKEYR